MALTFTVHDLICILDIYFPLELGAIEALYFLFLIIGLYPLFSLHFQQRQLAHQPCETAWIKAINTILRGFGAKLVW